ncbi:MAG: hypothetical protein NC209_04100 [Alistipes sp.]|nr:hypothetical protein [Lachnospiraceae bacterium]MCM1250312.1 hypothetical protein [Alistipes sp.]
MRQSETSIDPKNSTVATPAAQPKITYRRITRKKALRADFSEQPRSYSVEIIGKSNGTEHRITNVYEEYHPLMAIGRAVIEFRQAIIIGTIEHIFVSERIVSNR